MSINRGREAPLGVDETEEDEEGRTPRLFMVSVGLLDRGEESGATGVEVCLSLTGRILLLFLFLFSDR